MLNEDTIREKRNSLLLYAQEIANDMNKTQNTKDPRFPDMFIAFEKVKILDWVLEANTNTQFRELCATALGTEIKE